MNTLTQSDKHVPATITHVKRGDAFILRDWQTHDLDYVVWAQDDQRHDGRIATSCDRDLVLTTFYVWPRSGKVEGMAMYGVKATPEEAEAALSILAHRKKL